MIGVLFGSASLNAIPGREGITKWKGWLFAASSGSVNNLIRCPNERLENGKGGIKRRGIALA